MPLHFLFIFPHHKYQFGIISHGICDQNKNCITYILGWLIQLEIIIVGLKYQALFSFSIYLFLPFLPSRPAPACVVSPFPFSFQSHQQVQSPSPSPLPRSRPDPSAVSRRTHKVMGIHEDRSWMYNKLSPNNKKEWIQEFVKGVKEFIEYVIKLPQYETEREMRCPCKKCENRRWLVSDIVHEHLLNNGFVANYWYWTEHGESAPRNQNLQTVTLSSPRGPINVPNDTNKNTESKAVGHNVKGKEPASGNHKSSVVAPTFQHINSTPNLTVGPNVKGKEPASGNHRSSFVPPTFQLINSAPNLTKPPSPTPPVYSPKSDSNTETSSPTSSDDNAHVGTPKSHESSIGRENMTFIQPRGQERITEQKFDGPWKSFEKVPADIRDLWFKEVEKECRAKGIRLAKKSNKRPKSIGQTSWDGLKEEWGKELSQKVCKQNKKKRALDCDEHCLPNHKEKHGEEPTAFIHTHSNLNLEGERVWDDERSKRTHRRTEIAGGSNKGLVYGLGGMTSKKFSKSNCHVQSEQDEVLFNELNSLRYENQKLKNKLATTRAEFNSRMNYMEARFATFEQHMRFISMQQYASHYMPSMPYPPPTAQMPYLPQGGQPSLGPHLSSPPPSNEKKRRRGEEQTNTCAVP